MIKKNKGFSLIESIIYIALFSIVVGGGMVGVYRVVQSSKSIFEKTIIEQEGNFLLRKINWALNDLQSVNLLQPNQMQIVKASGTSTFSLNGDNLELNGLPLNSENARISNLLFNKPSASMIKASFNINGHFFSTSKFLRK